MQSHGAAHQRPNARIPIRARRPRVEIRPRAHSFPPPTHCLLPHIYSPPQRMDTPRQWRIVGPAPGIASRFVVNPGDCVKRKLNWLPSLGRVCARVLDARNGCTTHPQPLYYMYIVAAHQIQISDVNMCRALLTQSALNYICSQIFSRFVH